MFVENEDLQSQYFPKSASGESQNAQVYGGVSAYIHEGKIR
jgi:hypothetical protein